MEADELESKVRKVKFNPTEETIQEAIQAVAVYVYKKLPLIVIHRHDEDECSEFFVWLYPRFRRLVIGFNPERASVKTYIGRVLRFYYKSFTRMRCARETRQKVLEREEKMRISETTADTFYNREEVSCLSDPEAPYAQTIDLSTRNGKIEARKILLLACKSGSHLDDETIKKVAARTGIDEEWLFERYDIICLYCNAREERFREERERMNAYYIRARHNELELSNTDPTSSRHETLEKEREYCIRQWRRIKTEYSRHITGPSNRFLATTLGICRGTIDSTLAETKKAR